MINFCLFNFPEGRSFATLQGYRGYRSEILPEHYRHDEMFTWQHDVLFKGVPAFMDKPIGTLSILWPCFTPQGAASAAGCAVRLRHILGLRGNQRRWRLGGEEMSWQETSNSGEACSPHGKPIFREVVEPWRSV